MKTTHTLEHLCNSYLNNEWQGEALPFKKTERDIYQTVFFSGFLNTSFHHEQCDIFLRGLVRYIVLYILICVCVCVRACMLSCFSCVRLFSTLWTTASQAPLSMGLSRQEHWSGLPFPSPLLSKGAHEISHTLGCREEEVI